MTDMKRDAFAHALDRGLIHAYDAVARTRQPAKRAAEPHRQRAGNDPERLGSFPAHDLAIVPERLRLAQHPAPDSVPRKTASGKAAAGGRPEQHDMADRDLGMVIERPQDHQTAEAVPDEVRRADRAREAREIVGIRRKRTPLSAIPEPMAAKSFPRKPRGERHHHEVRHPDPVDEHYFARRAHLVCRNSPPPLRAKSSQAPTISAGTPKTAKAAA